MCLEIILKWFFVQRAKVHYSILKGVDVFTGIIEAIGTIAAIEPIGGDTRLTIESEELDFSDVKLGDSIASNGVCLTVTSLIGHRYTVDVSAETLKLTSLGFLKAGSKVNLEKAMLPTTRFGGHIVSGHVDGLGTLVDIKANARATDYYIKLPEELITYVVKKGSVTVDGISLTVNDIDDTIMRLTLIPHTQEVTTVGEWAVGGQVNIEIDLLARYIEKLLLSKSHSPYQSTATPSNITLEQLANAGFKSK